MTEYSFYNCIRDRDAKASVAVPF